MANWKHGAKVNKLSPMEKIFGYGIIRTSRSIDKMNSFEYKLKKKR